MGRAKDGGVGSLPEGEPQLSVVIAMATRPDDDDADDDDNDNGNDDGRRQRNGDETRTTTTTTMPPTTTADNNNSNNRNNNKNRNNSSRNSDVDDDAKFSNGRVCVTLLWQVELEARHGDGCSSNGHITFCWCVCEEGRGYGGRRKSGWQAEAVGAQRCPFAKFLICKMFNRENYVWPQDDSRQREAGAG